MRCLVTIPVYNEERHIDRVLPRVLEFTDDVLVVDDGSTDRTPKLLDRHPVRTLRHEVNMGYGRALRDAFAAADRLGYDWVITMDCDGQHEPESIPVFRQRAARGDLDIISGSRYLDEAMRTDAAPGERRRINATITAEINDRLGLSLTDAFCGFKAHRVAAMRGLRLDEDGYAFPMQLWARAAAAGLRVAELPVARIYNDPNRSFGETLDDPGTRLAHYRSVLHCEIERCADRLPARASEGLETGCR